MSEGVKQNVDTSSAEFKEGVKVGLNSTDGTKNWQAGIELGVPQTTRGNPLI